MLYSDVMTVLPSSFVNDRCIFFVSKIPVLTKNPNNKNHFMYFMDTLLNISSGFIGVLLIFIAFVQNTPLTVWLCEIITWRWHDNFFLLQQSKNYTDRTVWRQKMRLR